MANTEANNLLEVAKRIKEMRDICGFTVEEMAEKTEVSVTMYKKYEAGKLDFSFTFIHKCALAFGIGISDLLEGRSAVLSSYTVTRSGQGMRTAQEEGITITELAPLFRKKLAEPYWVKYDYDPELLKKPIKTTTHAGQEFDYVVEGTLKVQVGENIEFLNAGDSIYYNSATPHGMIAVDGQDCKFLAVVIHSDGEPEVEVEQAEEFKGTKKVRAIDKFVKCKEAKDGSLISIDFKNEDKFNFAFDIVDVIAKREPEKLAMVHLDNEKTERYFTFRDMKRASAQSANYFKSLGIEKGDRVLLAMKRNYHFWFAILGLCKLGAVAIPATHQLQAHDFEYRFNAAEVKAVVCVADGNTAEQIDIAEKSSKSLEHKILVGGKREGWRNFDEEFPMFSAHFYRDENTSCGNDTMLMYFTSGTSGNPKLVMHAHTYALGHYITAKYWHGVEDGGLHLTISDTGWGKAAWGKLYGQWMCEGVIFVYDFDRFKAEDILPLFAKYNITTFCAPPTMLRMLVKEDISKYDLSSIKHMTTAGEALNPEVFRQFEAATGLKIREGFGQTELTLLLANLLGGQIKLGSTGKPSPLYDVVLLDKEGNEVPKGESGEICVRTSEKIPCGLFKGFYNNEEATKEAWHDGFYHTGDVAWQDEDGYIWYVGRADDVIKSSGYRIGPFEIESVIMELPYVLECGVSAVPDEVRGQIVKASIVLVKGTKPSDELKKEIQNYVKEKTAPYKYPRVVEFKESLPHSISGKIQRHLL